MERVINMQLTPAAARLYRVVLLLIKIKKTVNTKNILNFDLMNRNYKFNNSDAAYFVNFAVVEWLDVFTRNKSKDILIESL